MLKCVGVRKKAHTIMENTQNSTIKDLIADKPKVIGLKQVLRHVSELGLSKIYLASDADAHIIDALEHAATRYAVPIDRAFSKKVLGKTCGIDVDAACVGILEEK